MDGVVNCVAGSPQTIVGVARAVFDAVAAQPRPPRVVHLSTMAVYGTACGLVDESAALRGDLGPYGAAKIAAEALARSCSGVVQLRPGIVYGPTSREPSDYVGRWLAQRRLGDLGAAGQGVCNLVYVDDVAAAVLLALQKPGIEGQVFNLAQSAAPTWNEYFALYAQALGALPLRRISGSRLWLELNLLAPPLKLAGIGAAIAVRAACAARAGAAASAPAWQPPLPIRPWLLRLCRHDIRLDVRKAEGELGMRWTPLDTGLRATAAWFLARAAANAATAAAHPA